jgi:hypothetical protein
VALSLLVTVFHYLRGRKINMKRAISILLLVTLSVTSVRPTVAAHYCGGILRAVGLTDEGMEAACCGEMEEEMPDGVSISAPEEPCCITRVASIATDDFRSPPPAAPVVAFVAVWFFPPVAGVAMPSSLSLFTLHAFPPGGRPLVSGELLELICVARN